VGGPKQLSQSCSKEQRSVLELKRSQLEASQLLRAKCRRWITLTLRYQRSACSGHATSWELANVAVVADVRTFDSLGGASYAVACDLVVTAFAIHLRTKSFVTAESDASGYT
uniref:Uncharacterized protein n=1 Tax=Parascaris univalens TaxID=6257 RepID=A0A915C797_PARUN